MRTHPLAAATRRLGIGWCVGLAALALLAGLVRLLPWLLDPNVPVRAAVPFARGVGELAIEAAIVVGWPVGWALAAARFAERGEARALMLLGESPVRSALSQWRSAAPLVLVLALASFMGARDANAPGRMAQDLLSQARASCTSVSSPTTFTVPFVSVTWLCAPGTPPRLYGAGPGPLHAVAFTASDAHIAGDLRRIDLDDARFSIPLKFPIDVHANRVVLRGMSPWTHASNVSPFLRSTVVSVAAALAAMVALSACLLRVARGTLGAVIVGASGPVFTLGLIRAFERADAPAALYVVTPLVSAAAPLVVSALFIVLRKRRRLAMPVRDC